MSENIDKIIYINLERRPDRREQIETELQMMNLMEKTERFEAILHTVGNVGCAKSHLAVLKLAKERKYKNVLIMEDDLRFLVSKQDFEEQLTQFFDSKLPYDVCMISYNLLKSEDVPNHEFLGRILDAQTASGYIVAEHYYDTLINLYEQSNPLLESTGQHWIYASDQIWKSLQPRDNWYYFKTRIGKQRASWSDIGNTFVDYPDC